MAHGVANGHLSNGQEGVPGCSCRVYAGLPRRWDRQERARSHVRRQVATCSEGVLGARAGALLGINA